MVSLKKKPKTGGFQSLGLSYPVLKGVLSKGYKVPTPIQRKTMPLILEGKDVVAMARTGSGKTAAFVIPMLEKLKRMTGKVGAKALILSPTRELSIQTFTFTKEIGRFAGIKIALIVGGDSMEKQFGLMHDSPDVIIATPGRLLHLLVEMDLKLSGVEYLVFDEADRLFEMGFKEQMDEILNRLPDHRQTMLFSATLPQMLVDFAKAGLHDPELVRLDVELKLSENLKTQYIGCKAEDKPALLLHLLKSVVKSEDMTVVFTATRHHVEYLRELLAKASIGCTYVYSALDQEAREMNIRQFRSKKVRVLLVTDVAARGIDIPLLENVINYNFPGKPKLFVHRVGRVARAGNTGTAYSLVAFDEAPFLHELHVFMDRELKLAKSCAKEEDAVYGFAPQEVIDDEKDAINQWLEDDSELKALEKVCQNAYKHYLKTRSAPSGDAVKKMKEYTATIVGLHPIFQCSSGEMKQRSDFLDSLKNYRPNSTIFEIGSVKNSQPFQVMRSKRVAHDRFLEKKKRDHAIKSEDARKEEKSENYTDKEFYLPYSSKSRETEKGLEIEKSSDTKLDQAVFDLMGDEEALMKKNRNALKWDRKKKKFVRESDVEPSKKKIKTESGAWIPASYKTNIYEKWKNHNKDVTQNENESEEETMDLKKRNKVLQSKSHKGKRRGNGKPVKKELRPKEEILKTRLKEEKRRKFITWRKSQKSQKGGKKGSGNYGSQKSRSRR